MFRTKAKRHERFAAGCLDYSTRVVTWQITIASVPGTVKANDPSGRALLYAAESSRVYLDDTRKRLLTEAAKLGIDSPDLPEPVWPSGNVIPLQRPERHSKPVMA